MILTGKRTYQNVPVSIMKTYRDLIRPFHSDSSKKKNFHQFAQRKISETFEPMDTIVNEAYERYNAAETPEAEALIAAESHDVTIFEIDQGVEWTFKNTPDQITALRKAKMIMAYVLPEPVE